VTRYFFQSILLLEVLSGLLLKNKGNCFFSVWYNIGFFSIIRWLPLINLNSGTELKVFLLEVSQIIKPFSLPDLCPDEDIKQESYKSLKITSNGFINNTKELMIFYLFFLFLLIGGLGCLRSAESDLLKKILDQIKWNGFIRLHLLVFLEFVTFGLINIYFFSNITICSVTNLSISLVLVILAGCWIALNPVWIKLKMNRNREEHISVLFRGVSTLVNEFKPVYENSKYQFYTIFLLYRFSLALSLVLLSGSPSVQVLLISGFQIVNSNGYIVIYLIVSKPFKIKKDAVTVFLSEFLLFFFVLIIGFRSLNSVSEETHLFTSICGVCTLWLTQITISTRFILSLFTRLTTDHLQNSQTSAIVPAQQPYESDSSPSIKESNNQAYPSQNNTELNENLENYSIRNFYTSVITKKSETTKDSSSNHIRSNLPPILEVRPSDNFKVPALDPEMSAYESVEVLQQIDYSALSALKTGKSSKQVDPQFLAVPILSTSDSIDLSRPRRGSRVRPLKEVLSSSKGLEMSHNSILGTPSESATGLNRHERTVEDLQIKEFLAKSSELNLKVGNKRLN
jgi:hypothetical protein